MRPEIRFGVEVLFTILANKYTKVWDNDRRYWFCLKYKRPYNKSSCNSLCRPSRCSVCCERLKSEYCKTLERRFPINSWDPTKPFIGQGFRRLKFSTESINYEMGYTLERMGYNMDRVEDLFTQINITMFIDPGRVSFYLREGASMKILDPFKDDPKKVDIANMYTIHPPHCGMAANRMYNRRHCKVCDICPSFSEFSPFWSFNGGRS